MDAGSDTPVNGRDTREPGILAGDPNKTEGPVPKAARTLDFGALSHVLGLHSTKVVGNIATATTRSRPGIISSP